MNFAEIPENLEKLNTPIIICDEAGLVIYKNTAAVRSIRLPRRHTSMRAHLGQTERNELDQLPNRKKPSVLTVRTGDRNARALVMPYLRQGMQCSLWVFVSLLQTGSVSGMFAELDGTVCAAGREICEYVKSVDELSLKLSEQPAVSQFNRMEKRLCKIVDCLVEEKGGWLFELGDALIMLRQAIEQPMSKYGYQLDFESQFTGYSSWNAPKGSPRVLIDLQSFFTLYLHLILFCCECAPAKQMEISVCQNGDMYFMETAFTLPYPPFFTDDENADADYQTDLSRLIALSPKNRFEILLFEAFSNARGYQMSYRITREAEQNMRFRMKLPVLLKSRLRSGDENLSERLFMAHDLTLFFWYAVQERFGK